MGARCPKCGADIMIDFNNEKGDTMWCDSCDATLRIISVEPPKVKVDGGTEEPFEYFDNYDEEEEIRWDEDL